MKLKLYANSLFLVFSFVATANAQNALNPEIPAKIGYIYEHRESAITLPSSIQFSTISDQSITPAIVKNNYPTNDNLYNPGEDLRFKIPGLTSKDIQKAEQKRTYGIPSEFCSNLPVKTFRLRRYKSNINSYWGTVDKTYSKTVSGTKTCLKITITRDFTTYLRDMQGSFMSFVTYPWEAVVTYENGTSRKLKFMAPY